MVMNCLLAGAFLFVAQGQMADGPTSAELAAMKKLSFLAGKWEGDGWMQQGPQKQNFKGAEHVQIKLQGKALLVEGLFMNPDSKKTIHETLAVITFDEKSGKYKFNTYLFNRPNGEFDLQAQENGFTWQMKPGNDMVIDYTMKLEAGVWHEVGEITMPSRPKFKFLEMKLKKL